MAIGPQLGLGTAKITETKDWFLVTYMNIGSFLVGERYFSEDRYARAFCRDRGLKIIHTSRRS